MAVTTFPGPPSGLAGFPFSDTSTAPALPTVNVMDRFTGNSSPLACPERPRGRPRAVDSDRYPARFCRGETDDERRGCRVRRRRRGRGDLRSRLDGRGRRSRHLGSRFSRDRPLAALRGGWSAGPLRSRVADEPEDRDEGNGPEELHGGGRHTPVARVAFRLFGGRRDGHVRGPGVRRERGHETRDCRLRVEPDLARVRAHERPREDAAGELGRVVPLERFQDARRDPRRDGHLLQRESALLPGLAQEGPEVDHALVCHRHRQSHMRPLARRHGVIMLGNCSARCQSALPAYRADVRATGGEGRRDPKSRPSPPTG